MNFPKLSYALALALGFSLISAAPSRAADVPAAFTATSSGWGHGIGLSQYGAYGMALDGYTADQILGNYFPGTTYSDFDTVASTGANAGLIRASLDNDASYIVFRAEDNPLDGGVAEPLRINISGTNYDIPLNTTVTVTNSSNQLAFSVPNISLPVTGSAKLTWNNSTTLLAINEGDPRNTADAILGTCSTNGSSIWDDSCPNRYKYGFVDLFVSAAGADSVQDLHAVNTLRVNDEYLYGLGEVPSSWSKEALKAQVVAARSYALVKMRENPDSNKIDDCACQIYTTSTHQVFSGFNKEFSAYGSSWVAAVNETISGNVGKVVTFNGSVISTYYSSSTGGRTSPSNEVWNGSFVPYLAGAEDRWSLDPRVGNTYASFSATTDQATLVARFRAQGIPVTDISAITISGKYASGAVSQLTITDSVGSNIVVPVSPTSQVTPTEIRSIFGVKSAYLTALVAGTGVVPGTAVAPAPAAPAPAVAQSRVRSITGVKWPSTKIVPGSTAVTGRVTPAQAGVNVSLQVLQRNKWVTVATDTTGPQGIWKTTWGGVNAGSYKMRVVAATPMNSLKTSTRSIRAIGSVSIGGPKAVSRGAGISVGGSVKAAAAGIPVIVQMKVGGGAWRTVATVATDGAGNWGFSTTASAKKNTTQFRVKTTDGRVGKLTSKTIRVSVR